MHNEKLRMQVGIVEIVLVYTLINLRGKKLNVCLLQSIISNNAKTSILRNISPLTNDNLTLRGRPQMQLLLEHLG